MKKILIVQDTLHIGGIEKSLINFLHKYSLDYDITLLLFNDSGKMIKDVPSSVKIKTIGKLFSITGYSRGELKRKYKFGYVVKSVMVALAKLFGRARALRLLWLFKKKIKGYDVAISYAHPLPSEKFNGGAPEFVLYKTKAKEKICFIHCDYASADVQGPRNDALLKKFTHVACVSESVKERFLSIVPEVGDRAIVVYNVVNDEEIRSLSEIDTFEYDSDYINIVTVARIVDGKGIDRAIQALYKSKRKDIRYYLIGKGNAEPIYREEVERLGLSEQVFFMGEKENPYAYMKNADYLLLPSVHEAAPMVFGEAKALGLKIITTETLSAKEMVKEEDGIICENSAEGVYKVILGVKKIK